MMFWMTISMGILLPLLTITRQANTNFTITPSQQVVGVGQDAVFRCRHPNTRFIFWRINESTIVEEGSPSPPGITAGRTLDGSGNVIDFTLTIMAQSLYNGTEIVCIAIFSGNVPNEETVSVNLTVQGLLSVVTDIMRDSSTITWEAPFSLDLTGVDPNIVYCVEVYNITCGVDALVVGDCNVTEPHIFNNGLQPGYIYRITISPRSNGQGAQNGTSNTKEEMFASLTDPRSIIMSANRSMVTATFQFRIEGTGVEAALYSLTLNTIDEAEKLTRVKIFLPNANNTNLSIVQSLPRRRLWNYQVLALNCSQHPVTSLLALSTHDIQSVTASSPNQGPSLAAPIAGTIVCVVVVAVVVAVVLFIVIHKRQAIHCLSQEQQQQQPGDSSSLKPLTTPPGIVQDEEAYDVLYRGPPKTSVSKEVHVHDEEAYSVLQREPLKTSASKAGVHYLSVNLGPSSGVMVHDDLHKPTEQYSELQQQEAEEEEEESFNEGAAAGSADNRCSDGGDATLGGLHLDLSDEPIPSCFHSVQGPTMAAELTLLCTEGPTTTCITQCTDSGNTDGQTCLLTLDGKQTNYVQGHRRYLHPVRASGVCNGGQHKDIMLYTKFL